MEASATPSPRRIDTKPISTQAPPARPAPPTQQAPARRGPPPGWGATPPPVAPRVCSPRPNSPRPATRRRGAAPEATRRWRRERHTQRQDTKKHTGPRPETAERPARELGVDISSSTEAKNEETLDEDARRDRDGFCGARSTTSVATRPRRAEIATAPTGRRQVFVWLFIGKAAREPARRDPRR